MTKIYVYSTKSELVEKTLENLIKAGAKNIEAMDLLKSSIKKSKDSFHLVICETPEEKMCGLITNPANQKLIEQDLRVWYNLQLKAIEKLDGNKGRSIALTESELLNFDVVITKINETWNLNLNKTNCCTTEPSQEKNESQLIKILAKELITSNKNLRELDNKLLNTNEKTEQHYNIASAIYEYRELTKKANQFEIQKKDDLNDDFHRKELNQEIDILIFQLHSVQEELENYYLKHREAEKELEETKKKQRSRLIRNPNNYDIDSLKVENSKFDNGRLHWFAKGLEHSLFSRKTFEFETFIESGMLGISFRKDSSGILRWPVTDKNVESIDLIPRGSLNVGISRAENLKNLSTSDWYLLKIIPLALIEHLNIITSNDAILTQLKDASNKLIEGLYLLPPILRFDSIKLKSEQKNIDYEHLWFVIHNMSLGTRTWENFEIRLGATKENSNSLSNHIKVEIPLINGVTKPFDTWFQESNDGFGPKWELRFDIGKGIADVEIFNKLSHEDKFLVKSLLSTTVLNLQSIIQENTKIQHRDWKEWNTLFEKSILILDNIV